MVIWMWKGCSLYRKETSWPSQKNLHRNTNNNTDAVFTVLLTSWGAFLSWEMKNPIHTLMKNCKNVSRLKALCLGDSDEKAFMSDCALHLAGGKILASTNQTLNIKKNAVVDIYVSVILSINSLRCIQTLLQELVSRTSPSLEFFFLDVHLQDVQLADDDEIVPSA